MNINNSTVLIHTPTRIPGLHDRSISFYRYLLRSILIFLSGVLFHSCNDSAKNNLPIFRDPSYSVEERVQALLKEMTLEEKADMLSGYDFWHLNGIERLGIPSVQMTDCGHGVTIVLDDQGNWSGNASCFPTAVGQAATWDRSLIKEMAAAIARETLATGSNVLLAPMVNIKRTPLNGRNYELFSEDPVLSGEMAAAFVQGVQSESVAAVIKAATANNQQTDQHQIEAIIDERTLREIYLPSYRIPIKKTAPWGLMTSYNGLNGTRTSDNRHLLQEIIKDEWEYKGFIVSDWRAVKGTSSIYAGLDLEMPGPGKMMVKDTILKFVQNGWLSNGELDNRVGRLLRMLVLSRILDNPSHNYTSELNSPYHQSLARKVAENGIVLLKNDNEILPFDNTVKKVAVIGPNAAEARLGGGGSASVTPFYSISPLQGLQDLYGDKIDFLFEEGCGLNGSMEVIRTDFLSYKDSSMAIPGLKASYFSNNDLSGAPDLITNDKIIDFSWGWASPKPGIDKRSWSVRWSGFLTPPETGKYKLGVSLSQGGFRLFLDNKLVIDEWNNSQDENFEASFTDISRQVERFMEAGKPVSIIMEYYKTGNKNFIRLEWEPPGSNALNNAKQIAGECDAAIIFAGLSNFFEGGNNDRQDIHLPDGQDGLIREIADVNDKTVVVLINGAPLAMPWLKKVNSILEAYYPGQEGGHAIANVLFGKVNPSGKLPETFPAHMEDTPTFGSVTDENFKVEYTEGIFVGYRHYDKTGIKPLFPFGHGLSYTAFKYSDLEIDPNDKEIKVEFKLTNIGSRAGAEVAQLYLRDVEASEERPERELKDFSKVFLEPGESAEIRFLIREEQMSFYSSLQNKWLMEPGSFEVQIGSSSRDIRLNGTYEMRQQD